MTDEAVDRIAKLRHDLSNPLAALLIETQLLLQDAGRLDAETVTALKEIETQARRIRDILQSTKA